MTLKTHQASHLDHITPAHVEWLLELFSDVDVGFTATVTIPDHLPEVTMGLYGPIVGDPPVAESEVRYIIRGARRCTSRVVERPTRTTRTLTVIAGPHDGHPCVLYTAYGGPQAPREPGDTMISTWKEIVEAREFWAEHALSAG